MRILLVQPTMTVFAKVNAAYSLTPPLGISYIAGYLRKKRPEYNIKILDCLITQRYIHKFPGRTQYGLTDEEIIERVQKYAPHVVGITSMYTAFCYDTFRISKLLKTIDKNIKVVIGGSYATEYYQIAIKNKNIDFIVLGEGEETFFELVDVLNKKGNYNNIKSLVFKENGRIVVTSIRDRIIDLDTIPFPTRDLLDMNSYINHDKITGLGKAREFPGTTLITSRGCPMKCVYCSVKQVWGRKWTYHSSKYVVDEIEHLIKDYGIKEFHILDDSISVSYNRLNEICDEIIKRNLNISWSTPNGVAHWTLNKEILNKMKKAGCYRITFGIESGNPEIRKYIGKPFSLDTVKILINHANKIGMWTICTFIIGFPNETIEQMKETLNFAIESKTDNAFFFALIPHPNSAVYHHYVKITNNDFLINILNNLSLDNIESIAELQRSLSVGGQINIKYTEDEINKFVSYAQKTFLKKKLLNIFINPFHYLRKIRSFKDIVYLISVIRFIIKVISNILFSKEPNLTIARMINKKQVLEK